MVYLTFVRLHLEYWPHFLAHQYKSNIGLLDWVQPKATKMIQELEHLSYDERLRELWMFGLGKGRLREGVIDVYKHLKECNEDKGDRLSSVVPTDMIKGNMQKIETHEIPLEQKKTLYCECAQTLEQVAQTSRGISMVEDIKTTTWHGPGQHSVADSTQAGYWSRWPQEVPSTVNYPVILCDSVISLLELNKNGSSNEITSISEGRER